MELNKYDYLACSAVNVIQSMKAVLRCTRVSRFVRSSTEKRFVGSVAEYFNFQRAIVGSPESINEKFARQSLRIRQPEKEIDIAKAKHQHSVYVSELKKLIPTIVEVPADNRFPDQIYVEEPAVILNGVALLTKMAPPSRAGEVEPMRKVLETMNLEIINMNEPDAFLDGGDVLFTGREFFVGLSERTNKVRSFVSWYVCTGSL